MTNLSTINHQNFDRLFNLTNSYNKATLLDKLIYWWQISTYTLNDDKIWFTRSLDQIALDAKLAKRTVERYLKSFVESGLIEKTNKLYKKKNLYIRITDKLQTFLGNSHLNSSDNPLNTLEKSTNPTVGKSLFLKQNGGTDNAKMAESIYKDKDINLIVNNNTISQSSIVNNLKTLPTQSINSLYPTYKIEEKIGEQLTIREKNYIKGMMHNIQQHHEVAISSPEQLFAEIVFSVLNEQQISGVTNFNHRIQIIAKLLREKRWNTPKGFYNHSNFGAIFRKEPEKSDISLNCLSNPKFSINDSQYMLEKHKVQLEQQFNENCRLIHGEVTQYKSAAFQYKNKAGSIQLVNSFSGTLIKYYTQQNSLQDDISKLEEKLKNQSFRQENTKLERHAKTLSILQHQEAILGELANLAFDVFCEASQCGAGEGDVDKACQHHEELHDLLSVVEKQVLRLEEELFYKNVS